MTLRYPRESVELIALNVGVTVNGTSTPTINYQVSVVGYGLRPGTWQAPDVAGSDHGYMVGTLAPGTWDLWVKITDNPEAPVTKAETFLIT